MIYFKKIENYKKFLAYRFIYIKITTNDHLLKKPGHFAKFKKSARTEFLTLKKRTCPGKTERMATLGRGEEQMSNY